MTSNFDFLKQHFPELAEFGENAEKFLYDYPKECVYNISLILEHIVKLVCRHEKIDINKKTLWELIDELSTSRKIEKSTFYVFETLRDYRNTNTHTAKKFSLDERMTLLQHAHNLCEWFIASRVDKNYRRRGFSMPQKGQQYYQQEQQAYIPPYVNYVPYGNYSQPQTEQRKIVQPMPDKKFLKLCKEGTAEQIIKALKNGANPNASGKFGQPALMYVLSSYMDDDEKIEVVKALVKAGAKVNDTDNFGKTVLMEAACFRETECVKFLIKAGAKVNDKDIHGETALMYAAGSRQPECVKILLNAGADVHARADDYYDTDDTALSRAASIGNIETVKILLEAGANIDDNKSILHKPASYHNYGMIEFLLRAGADVNGQDERYHGHSIDPRTTIMRMIGDNSSNFKDKSFYGDTQSGYFDKFKKTIEIMIKAGADVSIKDNKGKTALDYAERALYRYLTTEQWKQIKSLLKPKRSFLSSLFN